ncbi:MAG: hypothetical protein ACLPHI_08140 [Terriglobales bacterium]
MLSSVAQKPALSEAEEVEFHKKLLTAPSRSAPIATFSAHPPLPNSRFALLFAGAFLVSRSKTKLWSTIILLILIGSLAYADSISSSSDKSAPHFRNDQTPLHQYAVRLTGVRPFFGPSLWSGSNSGDIPLSFFLSLEPPRPQRATSTGNQALDLILDLLGHLAGHPHQKGTINGNSK